MHSNMQEAIKNVLGDTNYQGVLSESPEALKADFELDNKQFQALNSEAHKGPRVVAGPEMGFACLCVCSAAPDSGIKGN